MDDLISRKAAIEWCRPEEWGTPDERWRPESEYGAMLETLPSAQTEIIRCKDCEHWDTSWQNDYAPNYHYCPLVDGTRRDDFYCADAERREE